MKDDEEKLLITAGALVGAYFLVVKPLLGAIGVDPADKNEVDSVNTLDPTENPFSLNFPYRTMPVNQADPGAYWRALKQLGDSTGAGTAGDIYLWGETINDAFSWWHNVHINEVNGVFQQIANKSEVADISQYLFYNYDRDLFTLLERGVGIIPAISNGMPTTDLANIVRKVNSLPDL